MCSVSIFIIQCFECRFRRTRTPSCSSDRRRSRSRFPSASALIPRTESGMIPQSLTIPYHPPQMFAAHANQSKHHGASRRRRSGGSLPFGRRAELTCLSHPVGERKTFHYRQLRHPRLDQRRKMSSRTFRGDRQDAEMESHPKVNVGDFE